VVTKKIKESKTELLKEARWKKRVEPSLPFNLSVFFTDINC